MGKIWNQVCKKSNAWGKKGKDLVQGRKMRLWANGDRARATWIVMDKLKNHIKATLGTSTLEHIDVENYVSLYLGKQKSCTYIL